MNDLQVLLESHNKAVAEHVASMLSSSAVAAEGESETDWATEKASLLKRNTELAEILSHSQKKVSEQEVEIKDLKQALSQAQHKISSIELAVSEGEEYPYLSEDGSGEYVAENASTVLAQDGETPEPVEANKEVESGAGAAEEEETGLDDDDDDDDDDVFEEDLEETAAMASDLKRIFRQLVSLSGQYAGERSGEGTAPKELGKAEFDLLGQVVGLEDAKRLRSDLLSGAGKPPSTGLNLRNFLAGFLHKGTPVPGTGSVPSAVWKAVAAPDMGSLLLDGPKRELLETELSRWNKALHTRGEASGVGGGGGHDYDYDYEDGEESDDENDFDDEGDIEPWDLGLEFKAGSMCEFKAKYVLQGKKQGEEDLGEGRAGVVRKCLRLLPAAAAAAAADHDGEDKKSGDGGSGGGGGKGEGGEVAGAETTTLETGASREVFACKCISKKQQSLEETERELAIMRKLSSPGSASIAGMVSQLVDVFESPERLFVVTELCAGGELYDLVIERAEAEPSVPFSEFEAATLMKQVLTCVASLHEEHGVVHRDIKPENLLLARADKGLDHVVLIDYGLSRFFEPGQRLMTRVGTVYYTAPEVWAERYDNKCDVFSCGVLLYVLLCLYTPFDGDDDNDILRKVMRGKFTFPEEEWGSVSDEAKDFVKKLMSKYPRRRPSAREALQHEWFVKALGIEGGVGLPPLAATAAFLPPPAPPPSQPPVEAAAAAEWGLEAQGNA